MNEELLTSNLVFKEDEKEEEEKGAESIAEGGLSANEEGKKAKNFYLYKREINYLWNGPVKKDSNNENVSNLGSCL